VSDLPLRTGPQSPVRAMADAIAATVQRAGYRAGEHRVGYRSCDDSTAQSGTFDRPTCRANAHAYAAEPEVVAVVGPYNSPCAQEQIPITAKAPLAMVSPTTTAASPLLRGRRAYFRVVAADDAQGRALTRALRRTGVRRVFVLEDGESYGGDAAGFFGAGAREAGLRIVGRGRFATPARKIKASGAQAVFVGGLLDTGAAKVVRRLREGLGPNVTIAGPDGLLPIGRLFVEAGDAARGVLVSTAFMPADALPPAGRRFADELTTALDARRLNPTVLYAAQATQVALDAIAGSDGTRASVAEALARTDIKAGWLGRVRFTRGGDLRGAPVAILRAERGGGATSNLSTEGAELVALDRDG
jgi:branched-chain amino acid transport system substrate-binding protein